MKLLFELLGAALFIIGGLVYAVTITKLQHLYLKNTGKKWYHLFLVGFTPGEIWKQDLRLRRWAIGGLLILLVGWVLVAGAKVMIAD
jgi:hypothetical protein